MEKVVKYADIREQNLIVRPRARGGFIATAGRKSTLCVGVTAESEQEARQALIEVMCRMQKMLEADLAQQATH